MRRASTLVSPTRSQVVLLVSYAFRFMLGVALTALLGRVLEPDAFGFFTLVATAYLFSQSLLDLGSGILAIREIAADPPRERPLLEGLMGWRFVSGAVLAALAVGISLSEADPSRSLVWLGVAGSLLLMAPGALAPVFQVRQAQGGPAIVSGLGQILILIGVGLAGAWGVDGFKVAWLLVGRELLTVALVGLLAVRLLGYTPRPGLRGRGLRDFLVTAAVFAGAVLTHEMFFYADVFLLRVLRGETELGAYAAALRPLNPLLAVPFIIALPLLPIFTAAARRSRNEFAVLVGGAASLMGGVGALAAAAGLALAPALIELLYGGRYLRGELRAVTAFRWLCVALAIACIAAPFITALLADRRERPLLAICSAGLLTNVLGNLMFLPLYGFTAAAVTTAATEALTGGGAVLVFWRRVSVPTAASPPLPTLLLAVGVFASIAALPGAAALRVAGGSVVTGLATLFLVSRPGARAFRRGLERAPAAFAERNESLQP